MLLPVDAAVLGFLLSMCANSEFRQMGVVDVGFALATFVLIAIVSNLRGLRSPAGRTFILVANAVALAIFASMIMGQLRRGDWHAITWVLPVFITCVAVTPAFAKIVSKRSG